MPEGIRAFSLREKWMMGFVTVWQATGFEPVAVSACRVLAYNVSNPISVHKKEALQMECFFYGRTTTS